MPVQVVRLAPKEATKYGFVVWLEQTPGLLLRLDLIDENGALLSNTWGLTSVSHRSRAVG